MTKSKAKLDAIEKEARIFKKLSGDFMVKAIASFAHKNFVCSVMEYMPGGDLSNLMKEEGGRFFEEEARFYVAEIILALESLHKQGLVHRDLKPQNILLDANGHIKLADFGLSEQAFERK